MAHLAIDPECMWMYAMHVLFHCVRGLMNIVERCITIPIKTYQRCISPLLGPHCRYFPTCSQYFMDAVRTRGALIGIVLGALRLARCNPLFAGGYDPVDDSSRSTSRLSGHVSEYGPHTEKE